jgi:hypothetical protein
MMNYISESAEQAKKNSREKYIYGNKLVYIKDQLPFGFDLEYVLSTIESLIPTSLFENIDSIYVGSFKDFENGDLPFNAKYKDNAIYVTNHQDNENDMLDDIIHEVAHAAEERYGDQIYSDFAIESEFKGKRKTLYHRLDQAGLEPSASRFDEVEYDKYFDHYVYNVVGYPKLSTLTTGLFYSPYSTTSLREYFANGFENYFLRDRTYLKKISPALYNKINDLLESSIKEKENYEY